jgi:hypothetical protein
MAAKSLLPGVSIRKTIRIGPLNITLSKTGLSFSLGAGPLRVRARTDGTVGVSASRGGFRFNKQKKLK